MGIYVPPFYGKETIMQKIEKICEIDAKINALLIQRENYVEDLKDAIEEENNSCNKD